MAGDELARLKFAVMNRRNHHIDESGAEHFAAGDELYHQPNLSPRRLSGKLWRRHNIAITRRKVVMAA